MTSKAPRPKKNSDGQDKKPSANPDGGAGAEQPQGVPGQAPSMVPPGVEMVGQLAQQADATGAVPPTPGAGVPPGLQSFPTDVSALLQVMNRGFAPGADAFEHGMAQNAHALARAHEQQAVQQSQQMVEDDENVKALGGLLQQLMMSGKLPPPEAVAQHVAGPPQLAGSSY